MLQEIRPELHLLVLWEKARSHEQEILADVSQRLTILKVFDIGWSPECVSENYARFYAGKPHSAAGTAEECGSGRFLVLVLRDEHPQYGLTETSCGHERLNINLFTSANKYRATVGGDGMIHATRSVQETDRDAALLLGLNYEDLAAACPTPWDGSIIRTDRDLTGADGQWESLRQLFYTLNAAEEYVVLRGLENAQQSEVSSATGDIVLLVRHHADAVALIGGPPCTVKGRLCYSVLIGNRPISIILWDIRNGYHDAAWDEDILCTYEHRDGLIRVPSLENYFYLTVYHCLVNERRIPEPYPPLLEKLFRRMGFDAQYTLTRYASPFDLYYQLLHAFMQRKHYRYTKPKDSTVFFCYRTTEMDSVIQDLEQRYGWRNITPIHCETLGHGSNLFLSAEEPNGQGKLFIKQGKSDGIYHNEYVRAKELYELAPRYVVEPLYWQDSHNSHFAATRWAEGNTLEELLEHGELSAPRKAALLEDIAAIFHALEQSDLVHRDLIPRNLLYTEGHLKLIDFQFAVSKSRYEELSFFCTPKRYRTLCALGKLPEERRCIWDDAYAMERIIRAIGSEPSYAARYDEILNMVSSAIGKHAIEHPDKETIITYAEQAGQQKNTTTSGISEQLFRRREEQLQQQQNTINKLEEKLHRQTAKISKLTETITEQTEKSEQLAETVTKQKERIRQQKQRNEQQAELIQSGNAKIQQQTQKLRELQALQETQTKQIKQLSRQNERLAAFKKQSDEAPRTKYRGSIWRRVRHFNGMTECYLFGIKIRTKRPK